MANNNDGNKKRTSKSSQQQAKDIGKFAAGVAAAGVAASKAAGRKKSKSAKRKINAAIFIVALVVIVAGVMFYMDIAPFNFEINGDFFKFYNYTPIKPSVTLAAADGGDFRLHVIDVNQGDCLFLELPDGKKMLVDGGKKSDVIANGIINYLLDDKIGVKDADGTLTLDYVLLTHADADHCGSLDDVIKRDDIIVKEVYRPMIMSKYADDPLKQFVADNNYEYSTISTGVYHDFVKAVAEEKDCVTHFNVGENVLSGTGYEMYFYNPTPAMYVNISTAQDKNNVSPIVIAEIYDKKICLTGDADKKQENNFINLVQSGLYGKTADFADVDILKVGHHGGKESSNQPFLDVIKPEYAIISVGDPNSYGHPTQDALTRLKNSGCGDKIYRTDQKGNIVVTIKNGAELSFDFSRQNATSNAVFKGVYRLAIAEFMRKNAYCGVA